MTSELYEDESSHMENQIQGFESNTNEVFNFSTGMDMIGFGKNIQQQQNESWKCLFGKTSSQLPGPSSSSSRIMSTSWHQSGFIDDETNHFTRPSQGLSLSLSSNLYLQGQVNHQSQDHQDMRFVTLNNRAAGLAYDQHVDGLSGKSTSYHQGEFQLKNSRYLAPAQELLVELCSLGSKQNEKKKKKANKSFKQWEVQEQDTISILRKQSLYSLDFMELHKKKLKLLSMLEEVDRRYKHYLDQLKSMVSTFEDVAGSRSADEYTTLALTAMSKHFRCLRDAIVTQIHETKKAMGDKNQDVPGTSRGETPRLRALDQSFRRQKALQQLGMMENHPWRPQRGLPENSVSILRAWLFEHFLHPYPTDVDKHILSRQTGLSRSQVSNWFINARVRLWKPMVEEMYLEELKEQENTTSPEDINGQPSQDHHEDQKPTHEQLTTIDSTCLPPNITTSQLQRTEDHENIDNMHHQHYGRIDENFGAIDLDFSSYNHNSAGSVSYNNHNFSSPASVSLTLGLQQHGGSLSFSSCTAPDQNTLFYSRHPMEDSQEVQYSLIDGETQNLPHRDLMGAQLLHDLAG